MLAVIQRVSRAKVTIDSKSVSEIKTGFVVLLGVIKGDTIVDVDYLSKKTANLRIMGDENKKMNLNLKDADGQVLVVSQFTLAANTKKGNRPSFINAADEKLSLKLYQQYITNLKAAGLTVKTGKFGYYMQIDMINDGPATIILNSKN